MSSLGKSGPEVEPATGRDCCLKRRSAMLPPPTRPLGDGRRAELSTLDPLPAARAYPVSGRACGGCLGFDSSQVCLQRVRYGANDGFHVCQRSQGIYIVILYTEQSKTRYDSEGRVIKLLRSRIAASRIKKPRRQMFRVSMLRARSKNGLRPRPCSSHLHHLDISNSASIQC